LRCAFFLDGALYQAALINPSICNYNLKVNRNSFLTGFCGHYPVIRKYGLPCPFGETPGLRDDHVYLPLVQRNNQGRYGLPRGNVRLHNAPLAPGVKTPLLSDRKAERETRRQQSQNHCYPYDDH
jgi:hypothetical protein